MIHALLVVVVVVVVVVVMVGYACMCGSRGMFQRSPWLIELLQCLQCCTFTKSILWPTGSVKFPNEK